MSLPVVSYDEEMDKLISNIEDKMGFHGIKQPVTSTFSLFEKYVVEKHIPYVVYKTDKTFQVNSRYLIFLQWYID